MTDERDGTLVQTFRSLGPDSKDCLRLFSRGNVPGCYVLGWWAEFIANEYIKSQAVLKNWGDASAPLSAAVVNDGMCKEVIRDCLLRRGASVEFYERAPGGGAYACVQRGSPGNIADFEASLFEFEEAEIQLMSSGSLVFSATAGGATDGGVTIGFAALNTTLRQLSFAEYRDTQQLAGFDVLVAQTNLKELTLCTSSAALSESEEEKVRTIKRICERAGATFRHVTLRELRSATGGSTQGSASGATSATIDALGSILRVREETMALTNCKLATQALENLLSSVDLVDPVNQRSFYLHHIMPSTYMKLDTAAIEALNLVSRKPEPRGALPMSVYSWLNRCLTGMGSRLMRQWLLQPLRNVDDINQRLSMVELFHETPILRDMLIGQVLKRCGDMDRLNRKLQRRNLALKDTQAFLHFVDVVPEALKALKSYHGQHAKLLTDEYVAPLEDINEHLGNLRTLIEATVDFGDRNAARINPAFDDDLQALHEQIATVQKDIDKEYYRVVAKHEWNEKQLKYEYHNSYGYVFRVSRKEDRQLRASKELIVVATAKDGVRFVSDKLAALSEQYRRVSEDYEKRQADLKRKLVETIASYLPVLDDAKELIACLDVFVAWSLVAKDSPRPMVRPIVHAQNDAEESESLVKTEGKPAVPLLNMKSVRHPLVELRQPNYVANSVLLTRQCNGLIITGPNMGGKSTYMRSIAIAVVLAQAGCFVPADAAEITVRDAVMCRVGAADHLAQGVSTFMVEMLESAAILSSATSQTLAVVDELGRGTSTYDGFGLAWAIAHEIAVKTRAALLFSTHFHELTQLPAEAPQLTNAHFGAHVDDAAGTLRFSYHLAPGPCGRSYGLYVASLAHLPAEVVESAKHKAAELEHFEDNGRAEQAVLENPTGEVAIKVASYAKRARELRNNDEEGQAPAVKKLRDEITQDTAIFNLLTLAR